MSDAFCFIFGLGYTAQAIVPSLVTLGFQVAATVRHPKLLPKDLLPITQIAFNSPAMIGDYLRQATHVLCCIPPQASGDAVLGHYAEHLKKASRLQWLGYLSSTGVYGDHRGNWVDETSPCIPHTQTAISRFEAEQAWIALAEQYQLPLHIFRLAGIYGPGRNVLERLMKGQKQSIFKENHVFCRIHVEDIITTLLASIKAPSPISIYNIADDEPASSHVVDAFAASLLNQPPPALVSFAKAQLSPMAQEFYSNQRRVRNLKIKQELKVTLKYPTYREGLSEIFRRIQTNH